MKHYFDYHENQFMLLITSSLFALLILVVCVTGYVMDYSKCSTISRLTGVQTDVSISLGCMVKYHNEWVEPSVMIEHKQDITVNANHE